MVKKIVPKSLWYYILVWICETVNLPISRSKHAKGRTAIEIIIGKTPGISEDIYFNVYDWFTYRNNSGLSETSLGRWIGVSHKVGKLMSYWILTYTVHVVSVTTFQILTNSYMHTT